MSRQPQVMPLFASSLIIVGLAFAAESCNKPPTRSYMVKKSGASNLERESGSDHSDDTLDDEDKTGREDEDEAESDDDATKDSSSAGNSTGTDTKGSSGTNTQKPSTTGSNTSGTNPTNGSGSNTSSGGMTNNTGGGTGNGMGTGSTMETNTEGTKTETNQITECANKLSVGRIHQWHATSEGQMTPQSGLIVVKEGDKNVAKVEFLGEGWHVLPVWLKNAYEAEVDLSKSKNFTMTYSATAEMYVQLRPSFAWSGGDKWAAKIPSTNGEMKTLTVSFEDASSWTTPLGAPPHSLNEARAKARGFVFIGSHPTKFAVTSLVIDGYVPPCE